MEAVLMGKDQSIDQDNKSFGGRDHD